MKKIYTIVPALLTVLSLIFFIYSKKKLKLVKKNYINCNQKLSDFTIQKPITSSNQKRHNTWVTSFAHGNKFIINQNFLSLQASRFGFKKIINYDENDIKELKAKYPNLFKYKRGFGLWVWKPYVVLKTLEKIPKGDYLIYLDAGTFINSDLKDIFDIFNDKNIDIIISEQDWCGSIKNLGSYTGVDRPLLCTNGNFTKKSFLQAMNLDNAEFKNKFQIGSNLMFLRNTDYTKKIIQKWLNFCANETYNRPCWKKEKNEQSELYCNDFDKSNEDFMAHLEDQSMLSAILYTEQMSNLGKKKIKEISVTEYIDYGYEGFKSKKSSLIAHVRATEKILYYTF